MAHGPAPRRSPRPRHRRRSIAISGPARCPGSPAYLRIVLIATPSLLPRTASGPWFMTPSPVFTPVTIDDMPLAESDTNASIGDVSLNPRCGHGSTLSLIGSPRAASTRRPHREGTGRRCVPSQAHRQQVRLGHERRSVRQAQQRKGRAAEETAWTDPGRNGSPMAARHEAFTATPPDAGTANDVDADGRGDRKGFEVV